MEFRPTKCFLVIVAVLVVSASVQICYAEKEPVEDEIIKTDSITQASVVSCRLTSLFIFINFFGYFGTLGYGTFRGFTQTQFKPAC